MEPTVGKPMNEIELYTPYSEYPVRTDSGLVGAELSNLAYEMAGQLRVEIVKSRPHPKTRSERNEIKALLAFVHVNFGPKVGAE